MLQALTRGNLLLLVIGAAGTVWIYDLLYENHVVQRLRGDGQPPRVPDA